MESGSKRLKSEPLYLVVPLSMDSWQTLLCLHSRQLIYSSQGVKVTPRPSVHEWTDRVVLTHNVGIVQPLKGGNSGTCCSRVNLGDSLCYHCTCVAIGKAGKGHKGHFVLFLQFCESNCFKTLKSISNSKQWWGSAGISPAPGSYEADSKGHPFPLY